MEEPAEGEMVDALFTPTRKHLNKRVIKILKKPIKKEPVDRDDPDFKIKTVYKQCMDLDKLDDNGIAPVSFVLRQC